MRKHKLFANLKKCIFASDAIPVLGCIVSKDGVRPDPDKIRVIAEWPQPKDVKSLRKWLGMANYLHKYTANYAQLAKPLTDLLRKDIPWEWTDAQQSAFDAIKKSLMNAPILALPDHRKPFSVVCDASDFAIGCALLQGDSDERDRVISYQSRQLKGAELNYPVHDKELLAIKYALMKFRVHLLGGKPFVVYTDHASLRTQRSPPISPSEWRDGCRSSRSTTSLWSTSRARTMFLPTHSREDQIGTQAGPRRSHGTLAVCQPHPARYWRSLFPNVVVQ
jgi:hypothetical protein